MFLINKYCWNFNPGIPLSKDFRNKVIQMVATWPLTVICESYFIIWLALRACKMNQIARCDRLATRVPLGTTCCIPHEKFPRKPYNKSFIDQVCSVKMVGYWPRSPFASLWTSTSSRSINTQKKNLANIQPSWPHTWSITHMYKPFFSMAVELQMFGYQACHVCAQLGHVFLKS